MPWKPFASMDLSRDFTYLRNGFSDVILGADTAMTLCHNNLLFLLKTTISSFTTAKTTTNTTKTTTREARKWTNFALG